VGRAGAAFLSEITAKGLPGILIPYPYASENHQEYNASSLVRQGAADMILDSRLTGDNLFAAIEEIVFDSPRREKMSQLSKEAGNVDAVEKILQVVSRYLLQE
jgi:UDP-N-acetylglucosamine--N-acetylmuramyl-(pentapeptide) pyrophosphoryl-undecaprenol N-acetylglucosamine transferase